MDRSGPLVIAVDGHSSCGKSTFAKAIAELLDYVYIDSGAMYRAVTWDALRNGIFGEKGINREKLLNRLPGLIVDIRKDNTAGTFITLLNGQDIEEEIRSMAVSERVSEISTIKEVREHLVKQQRKLAGKNGVVMDGRDIGTVVFPDADLKIFMTATPEIRARRRLKELQEKGIEVSLEEVLNNIRERDRIDSGRAISPLKMADDAVLLDNSHMSVADQMVWFRDLIRGKWNIII
ncbi:MAG: (d)CMP kinase [Chlorobi bacterium]|nr:(d)CMP kinase [Chlorobiota bacterium]